MSPTPSRRSSMKMKKEKASSRKSSIASSLASTTKSIDAVTLSSTSKSFDSAAPVPNKAVPAIPDVKRVPIYKSRSKRGSIASTNSVKQVNEKAAEVKHTLVDEKPKATAGHKDPFNEPVSGLEKRQHERAVEFLAELLEKVTIPQTRYTRQRSVYYSRIKLETLVGKLTRYFHMNNIEAAGLFLRSTWTWVHPGIDITLAYREYLRRGCDPEYFTSGAGAGCVVS